MTETELQPILAQALVALIPGAQVDATRASIEYAYTQLDVQSVDSWHGSIDGLACRIADHLRISSAPQKDTSTPAEATSTVAHVDHTAVLVGIARALREQPTARQLLDGLDELGELSVCDGDPAEIASWVAALCHLAHIDTSPAPVIEYRAGHESIEAGRYTTEAPARQHCEDLVSREYPDTVALTFDWQTDEEEDVAELVVHFDSSYVATGYTVTPLEIATAYAPDADE